MLYLDDRLPTHPKILKAGNLLGNGGASRALHLYLLGISYARVNLPDGFLPFSFISSCGVVSNSSLCAKALSARGIGLWRKVHGGYLIHDFHDWNPKAVTVKEKREKDRLRKQAERAGRNGNLSMLDTARTRARAVPLTSTQYPKKKSTSTDAPRRLALARNQNARPAPATFALACVVMREAWALARHELDLSLSNVGEHFKTLCAQRGLAYDGDLVRRAYDAVLVAHVRRRA
jgi:hypothetical protein